MKKCTLPKEEALILTQVLNNAPVNGINVEQMRMSLKLAAKSEPLTKDGGDLLIEDAEHSWLCQKLDAQMWVVVSDKIINLVDVIKAASDEKGASA